ncbi:MAG: DUF3737 family protein [Clostridia bacterium]|nr:DUF3737 family protein [Clostridia bacterium]
MLYSGNTYDEERALYRLRDAAVEHCLFDGPADGESSLKECTGITVTDCDFHLRYPLWHASDAVVTNCRMTEACRAALWYDKNIVIENCEMNGIKALRECENVTLSGSSAASVEFGWKNAGLKIRDFTLSESEYPFFMCSDADITGLNMKGKYSFQYLKNAVLRDCVLDTKDAFWHAENVTVYNSVIRGEYLAWYSRNLRFVNCRLSGTQPLCWCENLVLENCTMDGCDLSFENSSVQADVKGHIDSVKNPVSGFVHAGSIGEIILDEYLSADASCVITTD